MSSCFYWISWIFFGVNQLEIRFAPCEQSVVVVLKFKIIFRKTSKSSCVGKVNIFFAFYSLKEFMKTDDLSTNVFKITKCNRRTDKKKCLNYKHLVPLVFTWMLLAFVLYFVKFVLFVFFHTTWPRSM